MVNLILIAMQIIFAALYFSRGFFMESKDVLGATGSQGNFSLSTQDLNISLPENYDLDLLYPKTKNVITISTTTAFAQKEVVENQEIPYETEKLDDEDLEYGKEEVSVPGVSGSRTTTYLITHWLDEEIDRTLLSTDVRDPVNEVVAVGRKIVWRELNTPDLGKIDYWAKMTVFATKYDATCLGCNNTTALGAPVHEGVCAVDPKVIPMYTHFYVPGYGKCQALDVGGLIKGNRIDLAFRDARSASWGAEYVDIYLMDNEPTE